MTLVGPRPYLFREKKDMEKYFKIVTKVKPGLTGLAQINGRNALEWEKRFAYDIEYVENITFINDMKILFKTVFKVLKRDDVIVSGTGKTIDFDEYRKAQLAENSEK